MRKDESEKGIVLRPADRARDRTVAGRAAVSTGCGRAGTRRQARPCKRGDPVCADKTFGAGRVFYFAMYLLLRLEGRFCSLLGVSVAGAAAHNIGQVLAAIFWMQTAAVAAYLPFLLVMSVPLGLVTGLTCSVVLAHMKKIEFHV